MNSFPHFRNLRGLVQTMGAIPLTALLLGAAAVDRVPSSATGPNAWRAGDPIPAGLLKFHDRIGSFGRDGETASDFAHLTNYALLQEILFSACDDRVFATVVSRALSLVGPTEFFADLRRRYAAQPDLLAQPRHHDLNERSELPHVVVYGLRIRDSAATRDETAEVFRQMAADLQAGVAIEEVKKKYRAAQRDPYLATLSDGRKVAVRVGLYGDYVISEPSHDARPFRNIEVPASHVQPLLQLDAGAVTVLRDEANEWSILYYVRESYRSPTK